MAGKTMTDGERQELARQLDKDLEEFIQSKIENPSTPNKVDDRTLDEMLEELKDHPAFMQEFDPSQPLNPAMEGLMKLKYECDDAEDKADSYKDDGNYNFKMKKYKWAIDAYTTGIKCNCPNRELNAQLYSNRAACHMRIGNYRTAFNNCLIARKFKSDYLKPIVKGVECCLELRMFKVAMKWCDDLLLFDPEDKKALEWRSKADKLERQLQRDKRKEMAQERKREAEEQKLINTIKSRGVQLAGVKKTGDSKANDLLVLSSVESTHPSGAKVFVDDAGVMHWPVMFLYPEYGETDFIEKFNENARLDDHIYNMFGPTVEPPNWDAERKYKPEDIEVYFEDTDKEKLIKVKKTVTLSDILKHDRYIVRGGTPAFLLLVKGSAFARSFLDRYK